MSSLATRGVVLRIATVLVALTALASGLARPGSPTVGTAFGVASPATPGDLPPDLGTRTSGSDWPTFLGPNRDGRSTETLPSLDWPAEGPPVLWHRELGEGYSMPTVARGRLFAFDRVGDRERLVVVESETGKELWTADAPIVYEDLYDYSGGPRTSPVVDGDRVYTFGVAGRLRAHRVVDGELLWEVDTEKVYGVRQNFFGVGSTPWIEGDLLLVMVGGSPSDSPGIMSGAAAPDDSLIVAFDKLTGEERYRSIDDLASYSSIRVTTLDDRRVGLVFARAGFHAFDPTTGEEISAVPWKAKILESVNAATPVVVGDRVFLTETYGPGGVLLDLSRPSAPTVVWQDGRRDQAMACHWSTPIHHQGILYGSSGRNSGNAELRAVELASGEVLWSEPGLRRSSLLYVDGHLIVLSEYGEMLLVEATPEAFRPVWRLDLSRGTADRPAVRHPAWSAPLLSHGILYARGKDRLVAFDLSAIGS